MLQRQFLFILCINLVALFCVSAHIQESDSALIRTLPAYLIASRADLLNLTTCGKELQDFRDAVDQRILWSLKVLDSNGGYKSGFLYGNNYWLGSRSQCLDTMNVIPLQFSERKLLNNSPYSEKANPPFKINYFVAHFRHNSTIQYRTNIFIEDMITFGLCLPASCTINNLSFILKELVRNRVINDLYLTDFQLIQVKDLRSDNKWITSGILPFICVAFGFFFLMTTIGTIYDIFVFQKHLKKNNIIKTDNYGMEDIPKKTKMEVNLSSHEESKIEKILICFSAYTNTKQIFNTKLDAGTIPVIHGLKPLSMFCIIMFHTVHYTFDFMDNKAWFLRCYEIYSAYIVDIGMIAVDIFFFSSGCLVTYSFLKDKTNKRLIKPIDCREKLTKFFIYIMKRFIRLTPVYMMVLGLSQLSSAWYDKTSQFYMYERSHETCVKYWWRNILYIHNFFSMDAMCMSWSWYLANDMQFYVITMMLLIVFFNATVTVLSVLLIGSVILSGYISYVYEYVPTLDETYRLADVIYIPPWMRINPYIIGITTGYILTKLNNNLVLKKKIIILCWCFAGVCCIFALFPLYNRYISVLATYIYVALYRIWTIGIAWVVIACSTKHGGIVNQLLSFKGWIPLSRLTYCAYLLNPVVIRSIGSYSETSVHFELIPTVVTTIGYIAITYFFSYMLSLIVEIPCNLLMRMFIHYIRNRIHRKV